jgi:hypothetical protein
MARRFSGRISTVNVRAASIAYIESACATEQGRFLREQGIFSAEQGAPERGNAVRGLLLLCDFVCELYRENAQQSLNLMEELMACGRTTRGMIKETLISGCRKDRIAFADP